MTVPWPDRHLLADLDAGLLDEATAREVRAAVAADPEAQAVLDALAATRAELAAVPPPPVPPTLAARWSAALAAERSHLAAGPLRADPHTARESAADRSDASESAERPPDQPSPHPTTPLQAPPQTTGSAGRQPPRQPAVSRPAGHPSTVADLTTPPEERQPGHEPSTTPPTALGDSAHPVGRAGPAAPLSPRRHADPGDRPGSVDPAAPACTSDPSHPAAADPPGTPPDPTQSGRARRPSPRPAGTSTPRSAPRSGGRRARRRAALLRRPAVLAGVLLVAVVAAAALWRDRAAPGVDRQQLVAQALSAVGAHDTGGLDDPARRAGCLRAVSAPVREDAPLLGGRQVTFEGRPGVLLVLGTGTRGAFDVVVVDTACGPAGGTLLAASRVGQ